MLASFGNNNSRTTQVYHRPQYRPLPPQTHVRGGNKTAGPYGSQQWQYFKRPLVANRQLESVTPQNFQGPIVEEPQNGIGNFMQGRVLESDSRIHSTEVARSSYMNTQLPSESMDYEIDQPFSKDAGTQSTYRDSDAQTDPFTPDVFVPDGENPEVLALADLKFPNGFKMTEEVLKEIDRIKRRRDVEANLPIGLSSDAFDERVRQLKELEVEEWKERERKILQEQEDRLEIIKHRLERRERQREERNQKRIEKRRELEMENLANTLEKLNTKRQKTLRKIQSKHANPENKLTRRDLIEEQTSYNPPPLREGRITHSRTIAYQIQPALLTDPIGIQEVELHQTQRLLRIKPLPDNISTKRLGNTRKQQNVIDNIEFARKLQIVENMKKEEEKTNLLDMYRATPRVSRPKTPTLDFDDEEDDLENAVITIQKLLKGREKQNDFFIGKERTYELIKELQQVEKVVRHEQDLKGKNPELVKEAKAKQEQQIIQQVMENTQAEVVSKALDYLSKELVRQREMERLHVLKARAEMDRRKREAIELGARQKEEEAALQRESMFEEVSGITDETIDTYLDQIFYETAERLASRQALEVVLEQTRKEQAFRDNERAKERSQRSDGETPAADENEIKDLVSSFLIPQVKRSTIQHEVEMEQKKYLKAVHEAFSEVLNQV